ncbi:PhzF family phenazine biosynthesis protein [Jiangella anatolica]|uniref:PhzF family phenazine biosynthesis protein n=1 Tax=Jiangella anatolica TaxID=2670374 RepID=A0A2W2BFG6_9ACTN|nr:PhzF family phenazine biosynthesis protein [Jiangella anatolica]PZF85925.1 PhzF family phenazine biosynthesis protein [Jiangella anatolica]
MLDDGPLPDADRRRVPVLAGTSHAVFIADADPVRLRFFTSAGELPACGHGTLAALAVLAGRSGTDLDVALTAAGRTFAGRAVRTGSLVTAEFDPGPVTLRDPAPAEHQDVAAALGAAPETFMDGAVVASAGRPRLLVPLSTRAAVAALNPDLDRLRAACDRHGLLGCYVHSAPDDDGRVAARMFAPSIGVPEDVANANSTACLAAHLGRRVTADLGDALGRPATVTATVQPGGAVRLGGTAAVVGRGSSDGLRPRPRRRPPGRRGARRCGRPAP